jgi:prepilin-type N-terminal cleavage/methylation domain-containing protein
VFLQGVGQCLAPVLRRLCEFRPDFNSEVWNFVRFAGNLDRMVSKAGDRAFTIVELLLVCIVIGVLAVFALPQFMNFKNEARMAALNSKFNEIQEGLMGNPDLRSNGELVKRGLVRDVGEFPSDLMALIQKGSYPDYDQFKHSGWNGPYIQAYEGWNLDPWKKSIIIDPDEKTLRSCGPNEVCNDEDDIVRNLEEENTGGGGGSSSSSMSSSSSVPANCMYTIADCESHGGHASPTPEYLVCGGSCFEKYYCTGGSIHGTYVTGSTHDMSFCLSPP